MEATLCISRHIMVWWVYYAHVLLSCCHQCINLADQATAGLFTHITGFPSISLCQSLQNRRTSGSCDNACSESILANGLLFISRSFSSNSSSRFSRWRSHFTNFLSISSSFFSFSINVKVRLLLNTASTSGRKSGLTCSNLVTVVWSSLE